MSIKKYANWMGPVVFSDVSAFLSSRSHSSVYCQILARQEEIPQKTSKNISRYFCSVFSGSRVTESQVY